MDRRSRTHAALRQAALELFAERGYDATTTTQIAHRAGVTEMTLFRHYGTKEALLLDDPYDPLLAEAVRARPADEPPMQAVTAAIRSAWAALGSTDRAAMRAGLRPTLRIAATTPSLEGALDRGSANTIDALGTALSERGTPIAQARVVATAAIAGLSRALMDWSLSEGQDLDEAIHGALDVLGGAPC